MTDTFNEWQNHEQAQIEYEIVTEFLRASREYEEKNPYYDILLRLDLERQGSILAVTVIEDKSPRVNHQMDINGNIIRGFTDLCGLLKKLIDDYEGDVVNLRRISFYQSHLDSVLAIVNNDPSYAENFGIEGMRRWFKRQKQKLIERDEIEDLIPVEASELARKKQWYRLSQLIESVKQRLRPGNWIKILGARSLSSFYTLQDGIPLPLIAPREFYATAIEKHELFRAELESASRYTDAVYID